jgi:cell division transport system permease protein
MRYFLAEGWKSARRNVSLISLGTMAVSIFVLGVFGLILMNLSNINSHLRSSIEIRVYMEDNLTRQGLGELKQEIEGIEGVDRVTYVSKDEGLNRLTKQLGEKAGLVDILGENPLPDAFDVRVVNADTTPDIASKISDLPHIIGVNYGQGFTEKFLATTRFVAVATVVLAVILLGAVVFIVGNTVRLSLVSRAEEIEVMKLVGATDRFIMWPFLIEGMIVAMLRTLAEIPFSAKIFAASRLSDTITPHAIIVTSLPSRIVAAFPISNLYDSSNSTGTGLLPVRM